MTPEENRERVRQWAAKNPEKANAKAARYYQRHREAKRQWSKAYYLLQSNPLVRQPIVIPPHPLDELRARLA